jgi:hypothetical protein
LIGSNHERKGTRWFAAEQASVYEGFMNENPEASDWCRPHTRELRLTLDARPASQKSDDFSRASYFMGKGRLCLAGLGGHSNGSMHLIEKTDTLQVQTDTHFERKILIVESMLYCFQQITHGK